MAEHLYGSEEAFVAAMNERAKALGMADTNFVNCCGLDVDNHMTSAYDVALMSRELSTRYPQVHNYTTIWMEDITHTTRKGSSAFTLANTNKLIRQYEYATGLKTGSTSLAKYCVSATAVKNGIELIAVIMAAPDYKVRFRDAQTLLDYGFANCNLYTDETPPELPLLKVQKASTDTVKLVYEKKFQYLDTTGSDLSSITCKLSLPDKVTAPLKKGDPAGKAIYYLNNTKIGSVNILYNENLEKATFLDYLFQILTAL